MSTHEIATARLRLRPLGASDAEALHRLWTQPEVRRWLWDGREIPPEQTREIVETSARMFRERGFGLWGAAPYGGGALLGGAAPHGGGDLLGFGGFWHFRDPPELELLFGVAAGEWGRGYATEITAALVEHAFGRLGFEEVRASTDAPNAASVRVLEKAGFRFERRTVVDGLDTRFYVLPRGAADERA